MPGAEVDLQLLGADGLQHGHDLAGMIDVDAQIIQRVDDALEECVPGHDEGVRLLLDEVEVNVLGIVLGLLLVVFMDMCASMISWTEGTRMASVTGIPVTAQPVGHLRWPMISAMVKEARAL